jgi:serine/threonine-protein kinase
MKPGNFFAELKRRNVYKVAVAYAVVGWLVMQVAATVVPALHLSETLTTAVVVLTLLGFPIALVIAWAFEMTPEGMKRTENIAADEKLPQWSRRKFVAFVIVVALLAAGFLGLHLSRPRPGIATSPWSTTGDAAAPISVKSIAVLPFENLSDDKTNAYFASGMQDMILTKLAAIGDLKVISRTSTEKYKSHPEDLKVVAQQLGVATILEGSVQRSGNQVLINVQLIDAATDHHLWAEAYPRTLENIFGVEGEVAQKVADALKAKLTPVEAASVARAPTQNAAAYDLFLKAEYQAKEANDAWQESTYSSAEADYRQAIALDPNFALAYANLAYNQLNRQWTIKNLTKEELATVKGEIDHALALAPDLPEAHLALGYYEYWGLRRYAAAIAQFQRTLQLAPSNVRALAGIAFVARRTGDWQESLTYFGKVLLISPRDGDLQGEYGTTLELLRRYPEADRQLKLALALAPNDANAKDHLLVARLLGFGDVEGARQAYQSPPEWRLEADQFTGDVMYLINLHVYPEVFDRRFEEALRAWDSAPTGTPAERLTGRVARVVIRIVAGQRQEVQSECEQLATEVKAELSRRPDSLRLLQQLSWVEVGRGRNAEAMQAAQRAVTLLPLESDAYFGARELAGLAQIAAQANAPDEALQIIQQLLSIPAGGVMSIERLRRDPVWDPLRKDERFQALLASPAADEKSAAQ